MAPNDSDHRAALEVPKSYSGVMHLATPVITTRGERLREIALQVMLRESEAIEEELLVVHRIHDKL